MSGSVRTTSRPARDAHRYQSIHEIVHRVFNSSMAFGRNVTRTPSPTISNVKYPSVLTSGMAVHASEQSTRVKYVSPTCSLKGSPLSFTCAPASVKFSSMAGMPGEVRMVRNGLSGKFSVLACSVIEAMSPIR